MSESVLGHLRDVLIERRAPKDGDPRAAFDAVSAHYPAGGENSVRRFEKRETAPAFGNIDAMAASYAKATDISVFDLWDEALKRAKKDAPVSPAEAAVAAELDAKNAAQESRPAAQKSLESLGPKATKRQAG
jgi:hypothetical protein